MLVKEWRGFRWCDRLETTTISLPVLLLRERQWFPFLNVDQPVAIRPMDYSGRHAVSVPNLALMRTGSCHLGVFGL